MRVKVTHDRAVPNIYYLHPLLAGPVRGWKRHLERAKALGCSHVCVGPIFAPVPGGSIFLADDFETANPRLEIGEDADAVASEIAALCRANGVAPILDVVLDRAAAGGAIARSAPHWFYRKAETGVVDPRRERLAPDAVPVQFEEPGRERELTAWWTDRLIRLSQTGTDGFRLLGIAEVPARFLKAVTGAVRAENGASQFFGWTLGVPWPRLAELRDAGLDAVFSSTAWWDGRASWFVEEYNTLCRLAPSIIGVAEAPFGERIAARTCGYKASQRALRIAAATGRGLMVPMGFEFGARCKMDPRHAKPGDFERDRAQIDLTGDIVAANALAGRTRKPAGEMRKLNGPGDPVSVLLELDAPDVRSAETGTLIVINTADKTLPLSLAGTLPPSAGGAFGNPQPLETGEHQALAAGEVRVMSVIRAKPVADRARRNNRSLASALKSPRVAIERISPTVEGGDFAVKRIVGERVTVTADIFTDGHDVVAAELVWRASDETEWQRAPMSESGNDRWQGTFTPSRIGRHEIAVAGWRDDYASLCHEIEVKHAANVDITLELTEARHFLEHISSKSVPCNTTALSKAIRMLEGGNGVEGLHAFTAAPIAKAVAASGERPFQVQSAPIALEVERPQAAFASWYELFPRSQSGDPVRHGTFADVIARLPDISQMGFDVLYFPPIHPIGRKNRKGPNNSLTPGPADPGSPYAIGSDEGGHDGIHPELGTLEDFRKLIAAARENGFEIALDFAIQCSPDHPWLREHPDWFKWRPDGTIKYAENPPKKYQDIVNVDFYGGDPDGLWAGLRDVVLFWANEGVRTFRVDNPHTKPLPFWQWMIGEVRARYPDVIFLSEAFTRPKMMYRLAKVGFSQSYTYFTWRNTKQELTEYLTELTTTEVKEFFRPHFFVNTPDINPYFLQTSGRPGFLIRAVLAATLSGLWGIYSGFEVCEAAPLPGREEYLDSEKYEIRVRDLNEPGNIVAEIAALNRIRKAHPALHSHLGVKFYNAFNDRILLYGKMSPTGEDMILVMVNVDPHNTQEATYELPLWEWKLPDHGSLLVENLMRDQSFVLTGKLQHVRLDPADLPFAVWRITPAGGAA